MLQKLLVVNDIEFRKIRNEHTLGKIMRFNTSVKKKFLWKGKISRDCLTELNDQISSSVKQSDADFTHIEYKYSTKYQIFICGTIYNFS